MDPMYIVLDIKTVEHEGGYAVVTSNTQHTKRQSADSQYYTKLASAANPDNPNPKRAVVLMTNEGFVLEYKCYSREEEPEPEPEPQPTTDGEDGATDVEGA